MSALSALTRRDIPFLFFLLFVAGSTFSIATAQLAMGAVLLFGAIFFATEKPRPERLVPRELTIAISIYVGWLIFVCLVDGTPMASLSNMREEWLFLILPATVLLCNTDERVELVLKLLAAAMILSACFGTYLFLIDSGAATRIGGTFSHVLTYGNHAATAAALLIAYGLNGLDRSNRGRRALILVGGVASIIATVLSNSRGPMLALLVSLVVIIVVVVHRRLRRWLILVLALAVLGIAMSPQVRERFSRGFDNDFNTTAMLSRVHIWSVSLKIVADHPLTGVGPGNFEAHYDSYLDPTEAEHYLGGHAHNDMLNVAAVAGLPGLLTFLGVWLMALWAFWRVLRSPQASASSRRLGLAALMASLAFWLTSLTEATFIDEEVRQLLMLAWGIGLVGYARTFGAKTTTQKIAKD